MRWVLTIETAVRGNGQGDVGLVLAISEGGRGIGTRALGGWVHILA